MDYQISRSIYPQRYIDAKQFNDALLLRQNYEGINPNTQTITIHHLKTPILCSSKLPAMAKKSKTKKFKLRILQFWSSIFKINT